MEHFVLIARNQTQEHLTNILSIVGFVVQNLILRNDDFMVMESRWYKVKITKLSDFKGAERFGTCAECGKGSKEDSEMLKITWDGNSSTILCKECSIKLKNKL